MEMTLKVPHEQIMDELVQIKDRLSSGNRRFEKLEQAVKPVTDVVEAVGGAEQFKDLASDALRGLAALVWIGAKIAKVMKWVAGVAAGFAALIAAVKILFLNLGDKQ